MPYQRLKSENYTIFGGINQKASKADLNVLEFLDISNMDFTATGALQQRPGTTLLVGVSNQMLSATTIVGFFGTTQYESGSTFPYGGFAGTLPVLTGATFIGQTLSSVYEFTNLAGASFILFSGQMGFKYGASLPNGNTFFTLNNLFYCNGSSFNYLLDPAGQVIQPNDKPTNTEWSFAVFVNRLFMCNGDHFYKWDGYTATPSYSFGDGVSTTTAHYPLVPSAYKYCLPPGTSLYANIRYKSFVSGGATAGIFFSSATYTYSYCFINDRGFYGPVSSPITVNISLAAGIDSFNPIVLYGFSLGGWLPGNNLPPSGVNGFTVSDGFGIGCTTISNYQAQQVFGTTLPLVKIALFRDSGPGTKRYLFAYGTQKDTFVGGFTSTFAGAQFVIDEGDTLAGDSPLNTSVPEPTCIYATLPPQFLEVYNNQMFMCGFSQAPSTVQFSDIGEPESVQPQNNFDIRTNDGDFLTGMKSAFSQLFFFKNNSFHVLQGNSPQNFVVNPLSDQYGCISNRAVATYQNYLMFLDKKGVCLYNGAQVAIASTKIDPLLSQMNINAAKNKAWMIHNKERNQVWCGIPVNGSTLINRVLVYDYLLNSWTHFDGFNISDATRAYGALLTQSVYFSGYSSGIGYYSTSLTSDYYGPTIALSAQTRYLSEMGQSVEKMWRRLQMNVISAFGATSLWNIAIYANYASTASTTFVQGGQSVTSRSDFGVSAKAISVNFSTSTNTDILQLQGFTIESRYQRST